jgi:hypothetical protein
VAACGASTTRGAAYTPTIASMEIVSGSSLGQLALEGDLPAVYRWVGQQAGHPDDEVHFYPLGGRPCAACSVAAARGHADVVAVLLRARANPAWADPRDGLTALHRASQHDHSEAAWQLIARGAPVDAGSKKGATPLMRAVWNGAVACTGMLLRAGADPTLRNCHGDTAVQMAQRRQQGAAQGGEPVVALLNERCALCLARQRLAFMLRGRVVTATARVLTPPPLPYDVVKAVCKLLPLCSHAIASRATNQLMAARSPRHATRSYTGGDGAL